MSTWSISPSDYENYKAIFLQQDSRSRGYLSGDQARELLSQSGLPHSTLFQVWQLADTTNLGKLNQERFIVAMHLIFQKLSNRPLPLQLPLELAPGNVSNHLTPLTKSTLPVLQPSSGYSTSSPVSVLSPPGSNRSLVGSGWTTGTASPNNLSTTSLTISKEQILQLEEEIKEKKRLIQQKQLSSKLNASDMELLDLKKKIKALYSTCPILSIDFIQTLSGTGSITTTDKERANQLKDSLRNVRKETPKELYDKLKGIASELKDKKLELFKLEDSKTYGYELSKEQPPAFLGIGVPAGLDSVSQKAAAMLAERMRALNMNNPSGPTLPENAKLRIEGRKLELEREYEDILKSFEISRNNIQNLVDKFDLLVAEVDAVDGRASKLEDIKKEVDKWNDPSRLEEVRVFVNELKSLSAPKKPTRSSPIDLAKPNLSNRSLGGVSTFKPSPPAPKPKPTSFKPVIKAERPSPPPVKPMPTVVPSSIKPKPIAAPSPPPFIRPTPTVAPSPPPFIKSTPAVALSSPSAPTTIPPKPTPTNPSTAPSDQFDLASDRDAIAQASRKARDKAKLFESTHAPPRPQSPKPGYKPTKFKPVPITPSDSETLRKQNELRSKKEKELELTHRLEMQRREEVPETGLNEIRNAARMARQKAMESINDPSLHISQIDNASRWRDEVPSKISKPAPPISSKPIGLAKPNYAKVDSNFMTKPKIVLSEPESETQAEDQHPIKPETKIHNEPKPVLEPSFKPEPEIVPETQSHDYDYENIQTNSSVHLESVSDQAPIDHSQYQPEPTPNQEQIDDLHYPPETVYSQAQTEEDPQYQLSSHQADSISPTTIASKVSSLEEVSHGEPTPESPWRAHALFDYSDDAGFGYSYRLRAGDVVVVTSIPSDNPGWCLGYLEMDGDANRTGWFPCSYLSLPGNEVESEVGEEDMANSINEEGLKEDVIYLGELTEPFEAEVDGGEMITFEMGRVVEIVDTATPDWHLARHPDLDVLAYLPTDLLMPTNSDSKANNPFSKTKPTENGDRSQGYGSEPEGDDMEARLKRLGLPAMDRKSQSTHNLTSGEDLDLMSSPHRQNWASQVDAATLSSLSPTELKRQEAIYELVATEKTYLRDLQLVNDLFLTPLQSKLTESELRLLFSNLTTIIMVNSMFLSSAESALDQSTDAQIGELFLQHCDSFQAYAEYCGNQAAASRYLQQRINEDQDFSKFLKETSSRSECRMLSLSAFLLEPVQRITRYPLLLKQITKYTSESHPDFEPLHRATLSSESMLEHINTSAQATENAQQLLELTHTIDLSAHPEFNLNGLTRNLGPRQVIMDGPVLKHKSNRQLHVFLFSDLVLLTKLTGHTDGFRYILYRPPMPLARLKVRDAQTAQGRRGIFSPFDDTCFQLIHIKEILTLKATTASTKKKWLSELTKSIERATNAENTLKFR